MPDLQQGQDVVGTSAPNGAATAGRVPAAGSASPAAGTGSRPLWASLLQPGNASAVEDVAPPQEEPALPARPPVAALSGSQADRLLASLKGVAHSGGPGGAPATGVASVTAGAPRASSNGPSNGPARSTQRPADGAPSKPADLSSAAPSSPAPSKAAPSRAPQSKILEAKDAPAGPRDPRSDDILPTARKRAFSFRLR